MLSEYLLIFRFEIIEFPAVLVDAKKRKIVDHFQAFVKPTINPKLSEFCVQLTGIKQVSIFLLYQNKYQVTDKFFFMLLNIRSVYHLWNTFKH